MTIGKLAQEFNINRETIRYYEKKKLLPKPVKNSSGYKIYDDRAQKNLSFIVNSKNLGFTLDEIKGLLALRVTTNKNCAKVREQAQHKIKDIDEKLAYLNNLRSSLDKLVTSCIKEQTSTYCPILDNLEH